MRNNRLVYAALAATVSACLFSGAVGAWAADNTGLGGGSGFGAGGGLGAGSNTVGPAGGNGAPISYGAQTGSASSNDRAVDRAAGVGQQPKSPEQGLGSAGATAKTAGSGKASSSDEGAADQKSGTTALGTPSDQKTEEGDTVKSGTPDKAAPEDDAAQSKVTIAAAAEPSGAAATNAPEKPSIPDISGNGFFTQKIAIDVPAFHGIEPKLTLNYNSARKTRLGGLYQGWLGYAWGLDGFDVIERATPGYGYPAYDANDVFLLNGEELVPCTTSMVAASCLAGGTHVTENENFKRVVFDATANTWTVTDRDGTKSLFKSVFAHSASTAAAGTDSYKLQRDGRFLLSEVTDTYGNKVTYSYGDTPSGSNRCTDAPVCYPRTITYGGGASISFYWEDRPDHQVMANGLSLSYTKKRLKTIGIKAGGIIRGAYALTYEQAPFSNTSRLTKVDRYGTDTVLNSVGVISAGTKKTIRAMTYDNVSFANYLAKTTVGLTSEFTRFVVSPSMRGVDLNFDGKDELYSVNAETDFSSEYSYTRTSLSVVSFDANGTGSVVYNPVAINVATAPGRFVAGKPKSVGVMSGYYEGSEYPTPVVDKYVIQFDNAFNMSRVECSATYQVVCGALPSLPPYPGPAPDEPARIVAVDLDADGLDQAMSISLQSGIADVSANGRQSVIRGNQISRYVNGAWVVSSVGVDCNNAFQVACNLADVNGDGATDIIRNNEVWLSTGKTYVAVTSSFPNSSSNGGFVDADNDGKLDLYRNDTFYSFGFSAGSVAPLPAGVQLPRIGVIGDFNGDGVPDLLNSSQAETKGWFTQPGAGNPNLLRLVTLETGGTVGVDYTPSTRWTNKYMPQVLHAVTKLSVNDGRGTTAATTYAYAGGLYDPKARKFLGYEKITVTKPKLANETAAPVTEITYRQDLAGYGLPVTTVSRNAADTASKTVSETYSSITTKPYRTFNTATETLLEEGGAALTLRKERSFDNYGNLTRLRDFGRKDLAGDETWTITDYSPNTTDYLVSYPRARSVRSLTDGVFSGDSDVYERHQLFYYDANASYADMPTQGSLVRIRNYTVAEPVSTSYYDTFTYDSAGNKLSHLDPANNRTEWDYDSDKLYVVKERAPKYFVNGSLAADTRFETTYTQNAVCGKPATKVDWNDTTETYTYDPFCRPYDTTNLGSGKFVKVRYGNEGNPTLQAIAVHEAPGTGTDNAFTQTYYDGLGRPWRVQTRGETATSPRRQTDTVYDMRGNAAETSFPYYVGATLVWTENSYDWQDRVVRTTNPDASYRSYAYSVQPAASVTGSTNLPVMQTLLTNEEGKQQRTYTDKDGNVILTSGNLAGTWINESRSYDVVGRLRGVRDHSGAIWTYTYDLMGNRLTAVDPDLGTWSYTYDRANRLISQTDALGAVTTLAYDQMDRLITKKVKALGEATATTTVTNTYDTDETGVGTAPFHNVGLLTKSTNAAATHSYSRSLTGSGTRLTKKTVIDGITHTTTEMKGKSDLTLWISYTPANLSVGTSSAPWTYDTSNRLVTIPGYITDVAYEADGQTTSITYANGVTTTFAYNPNRRFLNRVTTKKGTTVLLDNQYTLRDKLGRIKTIAGLTTADSWTYAYDDLGRLTAATNTGNSALTETYTYSATGNLLTRTKIAGTYTYPAGNGVRPHAPTKIGTKVLAYDDNGNMTGDGTRLLTWDRSNLLETVVQGASTVTFAYGPDGARASKTWAAGKTLYANANVEIDRTTPGSEVFTRYPHPDVKIATTVANVTTKSFLHRDHLSSVRLVTTDTGAIAEQTTYAAYGEPTNKAMATEKGYIGERFDPETGLMYLNARYYDPAFGRFVPKDDGAGNDLGDIDGDQAAATTKPTRPASVLWQQARPMMPAATSATLH